MYIPLLMVKYRGWYHRQFSAWFGVDDNMVTTGS